MRSTHRTFFSLALAFVLTAASLPAPSSAQDFKTSAASGAAEIGGQEDQGALRDSPASPDAADTDSDTPSKDKQSFSWYNFLNSLGSQNPFLNPTAARYSNLGKPDGIPDQLENFVAPPDAFCREQTVAGLKSYCKGLNNGDYVDPWNPFCGFIKCRDGRPERVMCRRGTWMGTFSAELGQYKMCRKSVTQIKRDASIIETDKCPVGTDNLDFCKSANEATEMNAFV